MNRRKMMASAAVTGVATGLAACAAPPRSLPSSSAKPLIVLVHGSWHWGGCFEKVADLLAQAGFPVATPDLTSHGYSSASWDSFSTIEQYAAPVEKIIQDSPNKVVLVAHSMGGVTATYLVEKYPEKIQKVVYLTAFMAPNGKRALDYILLNLKIPAAKELFECVSQVSGGRGLLLDLQKPAAVRAAFYADCSDRDVYVATRNVIPITSTVPDTAVSTITQAKFFSVSRVYIECTLDKAIPIDTQRLMQRDVPGARVLSLESSHSAFFSRPEELAKLLETQAAAA